MTEVSKLAYVFALIGGILLLVFGLLSLLGVSANFLPVPSLMPMLHVSYLVAGLISLICGVVAIIGASKATSVGWAVILILVGLFGGGLGGLLVIIGGVIGLVVAIST
jgi:hypothetical protein